MGTMPFREELSREARDFSHERTSRSIKAKLHSPSQFEVGNFLSTSCRIILLLYFCGDFANIRHTVFIKCFCWNRIGVCICYAIFLQSIQIITETVGSDHAGHFHVHGKFHSTIFCRKCEVTYPCVDVRYGQQLRILV